jgi:spermidine synthase
VPARRALVLVLFFASGFAGLLYQVLWMRELGRLFGNGPHAVATTLAAFFLGLAIGSHTAGRFAPRMRRPLVVYAWLEAGLAASALLYFALLDVYAALYAPLYGWLGDRPGAFLGVKFALAFTALLPPAFFMGGTLPAMTQYLVRSRRALGRTASALYAVNTLGAALGAWLAGVELVRHLGVRGAYALALATSVGVAAIAGRMGREPPRTGAIAGTAELASGATPAAGAQAALGRAPLAALAFGSGFATLALEVLWTRMFAQVLQNSAQTFALVLAVFLLALALGAQAARALMRRVGDPAAGAAGLLLAAGIAVAATPLAFTWRSEGLAYLGGDLGWTAYLLDATAAVALVLLPAGVLVGSVFPFLLRSAQEFAWSAGRAVGELAAINTLGGVAGSLAAGFVFLDVLGLWPSLRAISAGYLLAALLVAARGRLPHPMIASAAALALAALVAGGHGAEPPRVRVEPGPRGERLVEVLEGSGGTVAVIRRGGHLVMKLDNHYGLGGTDDLEQEERQALLPLVLHPRPRSAFFLGLGTGITAGAALRHPLERVVVTEISPEVVDAARRHFHPWLRGLFEDPRARVLAEDGRNALQGTAERFDVIVSDLFMPWLAGAGSLYSVEAYRAGRERLEPGGLYAQWLALFQLSREELLTIARSMREVFPQLTLWRGNFRTSRPIALLLGSVDASSLEIDAVGRSLGGVADPTAATREARYADPAQVLLLYQGNLAAIEALLATAAPETDARPRIEYRAAISQREKRAGRSGALVGRELVRLYEEVLANGPPEADPYLARLPAPVRALPGAGLALLRAAVLEAEGDSAGARAARDEFSAAMAGAGLAGSRPESREGEGNEISEQRKHTSAPDRDRL